MPMRAMRAIVGVVSATAVLMAPGAASAATTKCRIEKPARATWGQVEVSDLIVTNLPKHRTLGGSPCATADWLTYDLEGVLRSGARKPVLFETDDDDRSGVPPLEWEATYNEEGYVKWEGDENAEGVSVTFSHGRQRVSVRALIWWREEHGYEQEGEGS